MTEPLSVIATLLYSRDWHHIVNQNLQLKIKKKKNHSKYNLFRKFLSLGIYQGSWVKVPRDLRVVMKKWELEKQAQNSLGAKLKPMGVSQADGCAAGSGLERSGLPVLRGRTVNTGVYTLTPFCLHGKMLRSSYSIHKQGLYRPQGSLGYRVVIAHPEAIPSTFFLLHIPFCSFPEAWKSRHPLLQALLYLKLENATIYGWWDRKKPFKSSWALLFSLTERETCDRGSFL